MPIQFGSFQNICETASLVVCPLLGSNNHGIEPACYSRNVELGGILFFQPSACFIHGVAIGMTLVMIFHIRSKYTAIGRKEIVHFFWFYVLISLLAFFLDSGILPPSHVIYPWFTAAYTGLRSVLFLFAVGFFIAIADFQGFAGFSKTKPLGLWIIYILWPIVCVTVYVLTQLVLVFKTLDDRWPIGDIVFGTVSFVLAQVLLFAFSIEICTTIKHYIDCVMMVYKYWDSITKEDLEFSVGNKATVWEVNDPLLKGDADYDSAPVPHMPMHQMGGPGMGRGPSRFAPGPPQQGYGGQPMGGGMRFPPGM
ncbi:chitin synthase III catalytic subunit-domain-containing protein [Flagelloscypha sp. PMI_526]|nr:chitin synthase III catalytic subunit-domain-containing protein [Flagelloscypha sp. PMI_526]